MEVSFLSEFADALTNGIPFLSAFSSALAADRSWHDNITADVSNSLVSDLYSWLVFIPRQSDEPNSLRNVIPFLSEFWLLVQ